jgi:integrase
MLITPEAGTVKTKEAREVPIHSHILEEGFEAFLKASAEGYLFLEFADPKGFRSNWLSRKNEVTSFARLVVTDRNVAPSHGWRHTFKSKGFEAGIQEKVLDALCGHAPTSIARSYGSVSLKTKIDALNSFPRFTSEERTADAAE